MCVVRPPPGDSFWYKELVESLPDVVLKSKRGDAGAVVGTYNARACGIKLLKSARKVELVRLMRAAEVHAAVGTNHHPICPNLLTRLRSSAAIGFTIHPSATAHARYGYEAATNLSNLSERAETALHGGRCQRPRVEICARGSASVPVTSRGPPVTACSHTRPSLT